MRTSRKTLASIEDTKRRFEIVEILENAKRVLCTNEISRQLAERNFKTSPRRTHCDLLKIAGAVPQVSMHGARRTHWLYEDLSHLTAED